MPSDDLDAGWDAAEDEPPPSTENFESPELVGQSRSRTAPRTPDHFAALEASREEEPAPAPEGTLCETIPPPMLEDDYVQTMMQAARESDRVPYRHQLATLMEIDPLRFDRPEEMRPPSGDASHDAPSIETVEETLDVEADLLVNTMPPPAGSVDELDMLPFDEVLSAISQRPSDALDTRPPPQSSEVAIQAGLRLGVVPPPPKPLDQLPYDRVTLPGDRVSLPDRPNDERAKMLRRLEAKDYMGALILAESLAALNPNDAEVKRCAEECKGKLAEMYLNKLGDRTHVPRVIIQRDELEQLALDHRAGFLISCIDGASSLDEVLDLSGMPPLDTVRLLYELVQEGAVVIEAPPPRSSPR